MIKNYRSAIEVRNALNQLTTKNVSSDTIMKVLDLVDKLDDKIKPQHEIYSKLFRELMNEYEVKEEDGVYTWVEHEQKEEISTKATELLNAEIEEVETKLFDDLEIVQLGTGLPVADLTNLRKILKK